MPKLTSHRGFTLVEMVITVAVMAILVGLSMPAIFEYMRQRDHQNEEVTMNEIRKAFQAYLADKGILPSDTATGVNKWSAQLAGYTNLTVDEMEYDNWGRVRTYVMHPVSRVFFGNNVNVYYATLHSMGVNGFAEDTYIDSAGKTATVDGLAVDAKKFKGASDSKWWSGKSTPDLVIAAYSALRPGGDDQMMRYTNYSETLDRYKTTIERLEAVGKALESYSRSAYAQTVSYCLANKNTVPLPAVCAANVPENAIYYPRSKPRANVADNALYIQGNAIVNNTTAPLVDNSSANSELGRQEDMQGLMYLLGLPKDFCCSALDTFAVTTSGVTTQYEKAFYYYSNPRPRTITGGCSSRPTTTQAKMPARILRSDSGSCG